MTILVPHGKLYTLLNQNNLQFSVSIHQFLTKQNDFSVLFSSRDLQLENAARQSNASSRITLLRHPLSHDAPPSHDAAPPAEGGQFNAARGKECKVALGVVSLDAVGDDGV